MTDHNTFSDDHTRRVGDRDSMIHSRLDQMERDHIKLVTQVAAMDATVGVIKLEQAHIKELFEARLKVIERGQDLQLSETKQIARDITTMVSEPEKMPGGKLLRGEISSVHASVDEHADELREFRDWKGRIEGAVNVLRWMGAGGLISLGIWILRLVGLINPK